MTAILEKLSQSPTFLSLASRVSAAEASKAPLASPVFTGAVTVSGDVLQPNASYLKGTLTTGGVTRLFGLNQFNSLYIGGIDQTIGSIVFNIAQVPVATMATTGLTINSGGLSITNGSIGLAGSVVAQGSGVYLQAGSNGTTGMARAVAGSAAQHGYFNWINTSQAQEAYIGNHAFGAPLSYVATYGHLFSGAVGFTDSNFALNIVGSAPIVQFDSADFLKYDRTLNLHRFYIANASILDIGAGGLSVGGSGLVQVGDSNFGLSYNSGTQPFVAFDNGDNFSFIRSSNSFAWNIANATIASLTGTTFSLAAGMTLSVSNVNVSGTIQLGDANYSAQIVSSNPRIFFDSGDYLTYDRTGNQYLFNVASAPVVTVSATGNITTGGNVVASAHACDSNYSMALASGNARLTFDATDYLEYDRTSNRYNLLIGGAAQLVLDGGGMTVVGTELILANDANFRLSRSSSTQPLLRFDAGDQILYDRAANKYYFQIGGVNVASIDGSGNMRLLGTLTQSTTP